jgi:MFS family permease
MESPTPAPRRFAALYSRDYRLLWSVETVSNLGTQMQVTTVDWHIFQLLRGQHFSLNFFGSTIPLGAEALGLGTLGLVRVLPIILFGLAGGTLADRFDRRRVMLITQSLMALCAVLLALFTLGGFDTVPLIYLLTAMNSAAAAFGNPARQAIIPSLVPREHLSNAITLNLLTWQLSTIMGPPLAGLILSQFAPGFVYGFNAISFSGVILAILMIRTRTSSGVPHSESVWQSLKDGLRYTYTTKIIWSTMLLDFFATFFASARTMLPIVATTILHTGVQGYSLLAAAQPVGAVIASFFFSLRHRALKNQGILLLVSVAIYGAATALFGAATLYGVAFALFAITGAADTVSTVIRSSLRQLLTPDVLRGRMTGVNMIFFMGGPQLGELEAGLVAAVWGVPFAIISGGIATVLLTAWVARQYPALRHFDSADVPLE